MTKSWLLRTNGILLFIFSSGKVFLNVISIIFWSSSFIVEIYSNLSLCFGALLLWWVAQGVTWSFCLFVL